ncbi:MAG: alpha-2-macroglobulin family protein, partial [Thermoanaerobaculales bacterium]
TADVTDEGGETRSALRSFRLGFVAVEARFELASAFFRADAPAQLTVVRSSLDGVGRAGEGTWRLVELRQPERTLLPAEQPVRSGPTSEEKPYRTEGDRLRARWETGADALETLRTWPEGAERAHGTASHGANGEAKLDLGKLTAGAYRLTYRTTDEFGAVCEVAKEFVVSSAGSKLAVAAMLQAEASSVPVGGTARLLALSGLPEQRMLLTIFRAGDVVERRELVAGRDAALIEIPIKEEDRGGFGVTLALLSDHQFIELSQQVFVPWDDRKLELSFASFRDRMRPGEKETWRIRVKGASGSGSEAGAAELLAYMYDKSLDIFASHNPPNPLSLYPNRSAIRTDRASLGANSGQWIEGADFASVPEWGEPVGDRLKILDGYGIGGPGRRGRMMPMDAARPAPAMAMAKSAAAPGGIEGGVAGGVPNQPEQKIATEAAAPPPAAPPVLRSDFAETAFWQPHLLTGPDGTAAIEFTVPDSVTAWNVWVHAVTRDLRCGSLHQEARSVKDLMVRPYLPRFLREADQAEIKVVINDAADRALSGTVALDILDPDTNHSLLAEFGIPPTGASRPFSVKAGGGANLSFALTAPKRVGTVAFKVIATAGDLSDGELRPLPLLPGRVHLAQSRFVTLHNADTRVMHFDDLARSDDPTRVNEQMVVTVDAQLFYSVLQALPYLVNYPYECTEQTLNRFVSTGIVSTLYDGYPAVARMAQELSKRETRLETFDAADPNRRIALEETPWLLEAKGGTEPSSGLVNVLDPRIAKANREAALAKLTKAQTANGAFPWWPGGPPSPYMTLYIMHGLARAAEFGVDVPKQIVQRGWAYLASHYRDDLKRMMAEDCCWEYLTFLNYVATCYPDPSWMGDALTEAERKEILAFSFKHWQQHSPLLKGYLALTLKRTSRPADASLVWESVMDSAKTTQDEGTFWAPEDRSWLWYNDTIETHAFALRTLMELSPKDARRDGLVQWLLLNKKLNQWKSTRATTEVIYSLVKYLQVEGALGIPEDATVTVGYEKATFTFDPGTYTGKKNQVVIPGDKVGPEDATVTVEKHSKGFAFASATWQFSTEKLPEEGSGDFFSVSRHYFKRESTPQGFVLKPLAEGAPLAVGDEVEVQLELRSKHAAEYVHLRDPRAAGLEPENAVSRFRWDLGVSWYEEVRDSGSNFFFEQLPVGEYTFKYRLRANLAGTFKVAPATVQSMYAPEFNAYSAGATIAIREVN